MADPSRDLLRILVATDNHLGVWEKDEIRKDDSFLTFEEIFDVARKEKVDFVLLGGDLFHDNKPSRTTLVRTMEILSKYCLNGSQISFKIISNQAENFVSGKANFQNDNYSVGLPVFTIHGNHDDPSGVDNLSAVDVLSTCNLVNYFGKAQLEGSTIGKLEIAPVLLQKGATKIALYGLGNIRDERLARAFQTPGSVEWSIDAFVLSRRRPKVTPEYPAEEWFNIFVLHQNRVTRGQGAKNAIKEDYLPSFLDLVIWGHEHECIPDPTAAESDNSFSILQPGSSVATALSEGEAKKKHVVLLEILGDQWRTFKYPLRTVRPFNFDQIVLADQEGLDPEKSEDVGAVIERKVASMILQATARAAGAEDAPRGKLPLVRLRVDYTGFSTINAQRFGQKFVGRVANPHDMLLFHKAAARKVKAEGPDGDLTEADLRPEALDQQRVEQLLAEHLPENNVAIITRNEFTEALRDFVDKEEKTALAECVHKALAYSQSTAVRNGATDKDEDIANLLASTMKERRESQAAAAPRAEAAPLRAANPIRGVQANADAGLDGDDDANEPSPSAMPPPAPRGRKPATPAGSKAGSHAPGGARGRRQATLGESFARGTPSQAQDGVTATQRSVAARGKSAAPAKRPARNAASGARARLQNLGESDGELSGSDAADEIDEVDLIEDSESEVELLDEAPAPKRKRAAQGTLPVKRARKEGASSDARPAAEPVKGSFVEDSDSDAEPAPVTGRFGRRRLNMAAGGSAQQTSQVSARAWGAAR